MSDLAASKKCCRVCDGELLSPPLLVFPRSPASAQGFLSRADEPAGEVDLSIHQCRYCGLVQHDLPPVPYYKDTIRAVAFSQEMRSFRVQQLRTWLQETGLKDQSILEIGCGKGEYLQLLLEAGACHVSGLEHGSLAVEHARQKGLNVQRGYLNETFSSPWSQAFDGFAVFSFMEHWPDLTRSLRCLHGLLADGAQGLVEVPNFQFIVQNNLYSEFTPDHIYYFDPTTLTVLLERNGFQVDRVEIIWHDYILSARVTKRRPLDGSGFVRQQDKVIAEIHRFVERFQPHEVVVWGAGHQALAAMSMANLGERISHVIDSADFKQGKYTPGTRRLIKAPQSLQEDMPKGMIIMAAGYSDEVLAVVQREYPEIKALAILREQGLEIINHEA